MKNPFTLDFEGRGVEVLAESKKKYEERGRKGLDFSATVYNTGPNRNHVVLNEAELEEFAASFRGQPFLVDHSRAQSDRGGTILDSRIIDANGKKSIVQTISAVKPWAYEGVEDGTIDRFSVGWRAEEYICTVCDVDFFDEDHRHTIFDIGAKDRKTGKTVEVLMRGLEGLETSAVTHPAVPGTGVDAILAQLQQLSEKRASGGAGIPPGHAERMEEGIMREKILALLGLPADTPEPEALAAVEKRLKATDRVPGTLLAALGLGAEASTDEAVARAFGMVPRAELEAERKKSAAVRADELVRVGEKAGKITPAMKAWAQDFALRDAAEFEKCLASMPVLIPPATAPALITDAPDPNRVSEEDQEAARLSGLSVEKYLAGKKRFQIMKGGK